MFFGFFLCASAAFTVLVDFYICLCVCLSVSVSRGVWLFGRFFRGLFLGEKKTDSQRFFLGRPCGVFYGFVTAAQCVGHQAALRVFVSAGGFCASHLGFHFARHSENRTESGRKRLRKGQRVKLGTGTDAVLAFGSVFWVASSAFKFVGEVAF